MAVSLRGRRERSRWLEARYPDRDLRRRASAGRGRDHASCRRRDLRDARRPRIARRASAVREGAGGCAPRHVQAIVAREVRARGFIPLSASVVGASPAIAPLLASRSIVLFGDARCVSNSFGNFGVSVGVRSPALVALLHRTACVVAAIVARVCDHVNVAALRLMPAPAVAVSFPRAGFALRPAAVRSVVPVSVSAFESNWLGLGLGLATPTLWLAAVRRVGVAAAIRRAASRGCFIRRSGAPVVVPANRSNRAGGRDGGARVVCVLTNGQDAALWGLFDRRRAVASGSEDSTGRHGAELLPDTELSASRPRRANGRTGFAAIEAAPGFEVGPGVQWGPTSRRGDRGVCAIHRCGWWSGGSGRSPRKRD